MFPILFKDKIKRVVDVEKYKNPETAEERVPLEKGDKTAIAIAATLVYLPVLLVMCAVIYGLAYFFIR